MKEPRRKILCGLLSLAVATAIWLPCLHLFFRQGTERFHSQTGVPIKARELAARHLQLWTEGKPNEIQRMRRSNAEWDFMGRGFLAWSLAEMALRDPPSKSNYLVSSTGSSTTWRSSRRVRL